jgi:hypothetical protein
MFQIHVQSNFIDKADLCSLSKKECTDTDFLRTWNHPPQHLFYCLRDVLQTQPKIQVAPVTLRRSIRIASRSGRQQKFNSSDGLVKKDGSQDAPSDLVDPSQIIPVSFRKSIRIAIRSQRQRNINVSEGLVTEADQDSIWKGDRV